MSTPRVPDADRNLHQPPADRPTPTATKAPDRRPLTATTATTAANARPSGGESVAAVNDPERCERHYEFARIPPQERSNGLPEASKAAIRASLHLA